LKIFDCRLQIVCKIDDQLSKNFNCRFSDIYIQEEEFTGLSSFVLFEIFRLLCLLKPGSPIPATA
jgi:hypothetical protein